MSFSDYARETGGFDDSDFPSFAQLAKNDTIKARVEPGEVMVHPKVLQGNPNLYAQIAQAQRNVGQDPNAAIAGMSPEMGGQYANFDPNNPQHFFFKSIWKAIKKIAKNPIARMLLTAASAAIPVVGPYLAPVVSGTLTKAGGGSWGQAIGSAALAYGGAQLGGKMSNMGTVGDKVTEMAGAGGFTGGVGEVGQALLDTLPESVGGAAGTIATAPIGSIVGYGMGESLGQALGGAIDPPKPPAPIQENWEGVPLGPIQGMPLPVTSRQLTIPNVQPPNLYDNSNIGPVYGGLASGAQTAGSDVGTGGWSQAVPPGVSYLRSVKDREGRSKDIDVGTFGAMLDSESRRRGMMGGGAGITYY